MKINIKNVYTKAMNYLFLGYSISKECVSPDQIPIEKYWKYQYQKIKWAGILFEVSKFYGWYYRIKPNNNNMESPIKIE